MSPTRAVFLDAGFTLIHLDPPWETFFLQEARSAGLELGPQEVRRGRRAAQAFFEAHYFQPNTTWTDDQAIFEFWEEYFALALETISGPSARLRSIARKLALAMNEPRSWQPYPEAAAVLSQLQDQGYTVGVLSDWTTSLPQTLEKVGLRGYLDFLFVSAIEGIAKPRPGFFRRALERADASAEEAVMVGDNLYADVEGAERVGIRGILLDRRDRHAEVNGPVIRRLDELWPHLEA